MTGETHGANVPGPDGRSSLHWNVVPGSEEPNAKLGEPLSVGPLGPLVIATAGALLSTVNVSAAGLASTLPVRRGAHGERVDAGGEARYDVGDEHATKTPADAGPSSLHWKVVPGSGEENANVTVPLLTVTGPPSMRVSGAWSTS